MEKVCPTCKEKYDDGGNYWKKVCLKCYKDFRMFGRIQNARDRGFAYKSDIYLTHPSVTKEELDAWIKEKKYDIGWGAEELNKENWGKFKIWINSTNFD